LLSIIRLRLWLRSLLLLWWFLIRFIIRRCAIKHRTRYPTEKFWDEPLSFRYSMTKIISERWFKNHIRGHCIRWLHLRIIFRFRTRRWLFLSQLVYLILRICFHSIQRNCSDINCRYNKKDQNIRF
jgi:hypothetical protein